jgi:hypothetical protein
MVIEDVLGEITCDFEDLFAIRALMAVCGFLVLLERFCASEKSSLTEIACNPMSIDVVEESVHLFEAVPASSTLEAVNCVLVLLEICRAFERGSWAAHTWEQLLVRSVVVDFEKIYSSKPSRAFLAYDTMLQEIMLNERIKLLGNVVAVWTLE